MKAITTGGPSVDRMTAEPVYYISEYILNYRKLLEDPQQVYMDSDGRTRVKQ